MKTERDPFAVQLGKKLAEAREHKRMTQFQAAAELKVKTVTSVCRWETGAQLPDLKTVLAMAKAYGVTVAELFDFPAAGLTRRFLKAA